MDVVNSDYPKIIKTFKSGKYSNLYLVDYKSNIMIYKEFSEELRAKKSYIKSNFQLIADISHPNLIKMEKWVEHGKWFGFIMEYFQGEQLSTLKKAPFKVIVRALIDVCYGLDKLHEKGIIHRDLTPENILCSKELKIKITDFDWIKSDIDKTDKNEFLGKAKYISPEQCLNNNDIDQRSDLYSLGVIFYELYYGKVPFDGEDWVKIAQKHLHNEVIFPERKPKLNKIIKRLLEKDKLKRFQNVGDVALALSKLIGETEKLLQPKSLYLLPPKFVGRKKVIKKIKTLLDKNLPAIIFGKKGVGKTMLCNQLMKSSLNKKVYMELNENEDIFYLLAKEIYNKINKSNELSEKIMEIAGSDLIKLYTPFKDISVSEIGEKSPNKNTYFYRFGYLIKLIWGNVEFIIENVETANTMDVEFITYLIKNFNKNMRFIITITPNNFSSRFPHNLFNNLLSENKFGKLNLDELNPKETFDVIFSMLGNKIVISELMLEQIYYKTNGNPLLIVTFVKYMFKNQLLKKDISHWYFLDKAISESTFPDNFQDIIKQNFKKLDAKQQSLLNKLFLLKTEFDEDLISQLFGDSKNITKDLSILNSCSLIAKNKSGEYFIPYIVSDSLYEKIKPVEDYNILEKVLLFLTQKKDVTLIELTQILNLAEKLNKAEILIRFLRKVSVLYENNFDIENALIYQKRILEFKEKNNIDEQAEDIFIYARLQSKNKNLSESEKYIDLAITKSQKEKSSNVYLQALKFKTWIYFLQGTYDKAIKNNLEIIKIATELNEEKILAQSLGNMGNIYSHKKEFNEGLKFFIKQQKISQKRGDTRDYLTGLGNIANAYLNLKDFKKAEIKIIEFLNEARRIGDTYHIAIAYGRFGALNLRKQNWQTALDYYLKKWDLIKNTARIYQKAATLSKLGALNLSLKKYNQALFYYQENLSQLLQIGNLFDAGLTQKKIGEIYLKLSLNKDAEKILFDALKSLITAKRMDLYYKTKLLLIDVYIRNRQIKKANTLIKEIKEKSANFLPKIDILLTESRLNFIKSNDKNSKFAIVSELINLLKDEKDEEKRDEIYDVINQYYEAGLFRKESVNKINSSNTPNEAIWSQPELLKKILNLITPKTAYDELLNYLVQVCNADNCQIVVYDNQISNIQSLIISPDLKRNPLDFSKTILNDVLYNKKIVYLPNAVNLSKFKSSESVIGKVFLSVIAVPLSLKGYQYSAIYLDRRKIGKGPFDENDLKKIKDIGKLITPIIDKYEDIFNLDAKVRIEGLDLLIGSSAPMQKLYEQIRKAANYDIPVLITGESGTGKDLVAQAIHRLSNERSGKFVAINCAAIPHDLAESILFGHEKGAFTGAVKMNIGKFEQAQNGTFFLDEIGELPFDLQAKLLRILETRTLTRLGGRKTIKLNARIIAATNKDIDKEAKEGNFRNDLLHRLNIFTIYIPPLRERKEDIPYLAKYFLKNSDYADKKSSQNFSSASINAMMNYDWSQNNVRELKNKIDKSLLLTKGKNIINPEDIFPNAHLSVKKDLVDINETISGGKLDEVIKKVEREIVENTLKSNNWNKSRTANQLAISRPRLDKIIKENGLSKKV